MVENEEQKLEQIRTRREYISTHFPALPIKKWLETVFSGNQNTSDLPFSLSSSKTSSEALSYAVYAHQGREVTMPLLVFADDLGNTYLALCIKGVGTTPVSDQMAEQNLDRPFHRSSEKIWGASQLEGVIKDVEFSEELIKAGLSCARPVAVLLRMDEESTDLDFATVLYVRAFPTPNRLDTFLTLSDGQVDQLQTILDEERMYLIKRNKLESDSTELSHLEVVLENFEKTTKYLIDNRIANINVGPNNICAEGTMLDFDHFVRFDESGEVIDSNGELIVPEVAWRESFTYLAHTYNAIYWGFQLILDKKLVSKLVYESMLRVSDIFFDKNIFDIDEETFGFWNFMFKKFEKWQFS